MIKLILISIFTLFPLSAQKLSIEAQGAYFGHMKDTGDPDISDKFEKAFGLLDPAIANYFKDGFGYEIGARLGFDLFKEDASEIGTLLLGAFYTGHVIKADNFDPNTPRLYSKELNISSFSPYIGFGKTLNNQFFVYGLIGPNFRKYKSTNAKNLDFHYQKKIKVVNIFVSDKVKEVDAKGDATYQYSNSTSLRLSLGVDIENLANTPFLIGLALSFDIGNTSLKSVIGNKTHIDNEKLMDNDIAISLKLGFQLDFAGDN